MQKAEKDPRRLEAGRRLTQLLIQRLKAIQSAVGEEKVEFSAQSGDGEFYTTMLSLTPRNSRAAGVKAYVHEGDPSTVYLGLGESTWVEVFGPRTPEALTDRIAELIELVRGGRFKEKIWKRRGKVTDTHGRIQLASGRWRLIGRINRPLVGWGYDVEHQEYRPWD
jgi:hypothetical protein